MVVKAHTFCPQCGWDVEVDEDGLCLQCGALAMGEAVDAMAEEREQRNKAQ